MPGPGIVCNTRPMMLRLPVVAGLFLAVSCGGDSGTSGDGGATMDTPPATGSDLEKLGDEFDGSALDPTWQRFRPEVIDLDVSSGALHVTPNQQVLWFNQSQGPLLYKLVSGDFKVSGSVQSRLASSPALPPDQTVHLGGLMVRKPVAPGDGAQEDYVFIVVGFDVDDLSVETKTTDNGASTFEGPSWPFAGDAELRICRLGSTFRMYKRAPGSSDWTLAITYERTDMPGDVQVGALVYANTAAPDLRVSFDWLRFAPVNDVAGCTADEP